MRLKAAGCRLQRFPGADTRMDIQYESDEIFRFLIRRIKEPTADRSFLNDRYGDVGQWGRETREWVRGLLSYSPPPVPPAPVVTDEEDFGSYVRRKLYFKSAEDVRIPAYLLVPKRLEGPAPAVVALHDHSGKFYWGKDKLVDHKQRPPGVAWLQLWRYGNRGFASALAARGYVVIVIDALRFGERGWLRESWLRDGADSLRGLEEGSAEYIDAYDEVWRKTDDKMSLAMLHAGMTQMGVMVWDDIRSVDLLCTLAEVDRGRIACVGLSLGGYRAAWLAAMDERIRCCCSVGYVFRFQDEIPHAQPNLWAAVPGLYDRLPYPDLISLAVPRDLLILYGQNDKIFPMSSADAAVEKIRKVYAKAGAPSRLASRAFPVGHQFDLAMQEFAFEWLDEGLRSGRRPA
jgi:dienelactone hydrolase